MRMRMTRHKRMTPWGLMRMTRDKRMRMTPWGLVSVGRFFVAKQEHLKKVPKTVFLGINLDGCSIFKTSDKSLVETYRFAKLKSWAASPVQVTAPAPRPRPAPRPSPAPRPDPRPPRAASGTTACAPRRRRLGL